MTSPIGAYNLWDSRTSLGVMRDTRPEPRPFSRFFTNGIRSTTEWIDFEKLPLKERRLAPFVKPLGQGRGIYTDKANGMRFKPAYLKVDEAVDPLRPLTYQPGIDMSMFNPNELTPVQRIELLKVAMTVDAMDSIERRWEWLRAKALIDGKVTCNYEDGDTVVVDFNRDASHTEVLTAGNRWGDAGVSIYDKFQSIVDTMNDAAFSGLPVQVEMGGGVWSVMRKDQEIKDNLDKYRPVGGLTIERGVVTSGDRSKRYKVGELQIGGGSGITIELFVNNEYYTADDGTQVRYLENNSMVFLATPDTIQGFECFGMIVDRDAQYQALPIFPKNFLTGEDVKVEHLSFKSAPLMVPIGPNGTYKLTPVA